MGDYWEFSCEQDEFRTGEGWLRLFDSQMIALIFISIPPELGRIQYQLNQMLIFYELFAYRIICE